MLIYIAHLFLQASPRDLDVAKRIAIWGKVLKNHKGVRALKAEYGVSTIENVEDQHDTAAQTNIDTEDIDTDVIMENAVNEEVGTITNSATDNVVDEEPYVDIDHSMEENDDQQQPASSVDEEQPKSGMDEQQPTNSVDEQQPTSDVHEQQPTSGVHEQESESSIDEQQQPTSSVDEQQPTSNVDEQEPESSMKQQDMDMRPLPAWRLPDNDMDVDAMDIEAWTNHWVSQCGYGMQANKCIHGLFYRKNMIQNTAVYVSRTIPVQKTSWCIVVIHFVRSWCTKVIMT